MAIILRTTFSNAFLWMKTIDWWVRLIIIISLSLLQCKCDTAVSHMVPRSQDMGIQFVHLIQLWQAPLHSAAVLPGFLSAKWPKYIDCLVQDRRNSSALAMEFRLSCTNPLICGAISLVNLFRGLRASHIPKFPPTGGYDVTLFTGGYGSLHFWS